MFILARFRLGLPPGVRSLLCTASSWAFNAWLSRSASIGSDPAFSKPFEKLALVCPRLPIATGGVPASRGETKAAECESPIVREMTEEL